MGDSILLAVTPETHARLAAVLGGHDMAWAESFDKVCAELDRRHFDLIVIGAHFQESTSFDVLRVAAAARPASRIVCLRGVATRTLLGKPSMDAFRAACEALGAALVVDLLEYPDDAAGNAAVRALLEHQLELVA